MWRVHVLDAGIPELIWALEQGGRQIFLVSGGFRQVIHPIAELLGIPVENVFANTILYNVRLHTVVCCAHLSHCLRASWQFWCGHCLPSAG